MPIPVCADTSTACTSPPACSSGTPMAMRLANARGVRALDIRTLSARRRVAIRAAMMCAAASLVWGITPSSAAHTSTATSVTLAPRLRIALKAACPGVSRKVS